MAGEREPSIRQRRLGDLIARELSLVLQQRAHDPRLEGAIVTGVQVTRDLRQATVYITTATGQDRAEALAALERSEAFLRHQVAERVYLRFMPQLEFRADDTYDRARRIESLLDEVAQDDSQAESDGASQDERPEDAD